MAMLGENAPGGWDKQWLCLTASNYSCDGDLTHESKNIKKGQVLSPNGCRGKNATNPPGYVTPYQAAALLGLNKKTVSGWAGRRNIPVFMHDGYMFVKLEDVKALAKSRRK
jgi:hypothetical protein